MQNPLPSFVACADLKGGGGRGVRTPLEFAKLDIADIMGNEKISYFSYLCTSTVVRQTESIHNNNQITSIQVCVMGFFLLKVGPPLEKFSGSAPVDHRYYDYIMRALSA